MKIAIECRSVLLQKALERFLSGHLTSLKHAELVIRDYKSEDQKSFYIASSKDADLTKPFSKSQLILALQNSFKEFAKMKKEEKKDFEILEKRIEVLTEEYKRNILEAIKAFYG